MRLAAKFELIVSKTAITFVAFDHEEYMRCFAARGFQKGGNAGPWLWK